MISHLRELLDPGAERRAAGDSSLESAAQQGLRLLEDNRVVEPWRTHDAGVEVPLAGGEARGEELLNDLGPRGDLGVEADVHL